MPVAYKVFYLVRIIGCNTLWKTILCVSTSYFIRVRIAEPEDAELKSIGYGPRQAPCVYYTLASTVIAARSAKCFKFLPPVWQQHCRASITSARARVPLISGDKVIATLTARRCTAPTHASRPIVRFEFTWQQGEPVMPGYSCQRNAAATSQHKNVGSKR